jgi:hypothetical protein
MRPELIYVELKSGYSDNGPAWIGKADYSKTGRMLYFNGMALRRLQRRQNFETHANPETGDYYWVSGVKKDQTDRHWAGSGVIMIDRAVVSEYLNYVGASTLSKTKYKVVTFVDNTRIITKANVMENMKIATQASQGGAGF